MQIIELFKYNEQDGSVTVTPNKRTETDTPHCFRLIANEGMLLFDGQNECHCIDTTDVEKYKEIIDENWQEVNESEVKTDAE